MTAAVAEKTMTAAEYAERLTRGQEVPRHVEEGAAFGRALAEALMARGWRRAEAYSTCSKATFEERLARSGRVVEITCACFFGPFTIVNVYR